MADLDAVQHQLAPLADAARSLSWNRERPWRPESHVWSESGLVVVDLHDLSVRLGVEAVERAAALAPELAAVVFVTGRGRHSVEGRSRLNDGVTEAVEALCAARGWAWRVPRPGRVLLIADPARAPRAATGALGPLFWLGALGFAGLAALASPLLGGLIALAVVAAWWADRRR
ncbi:MAG: hypothetical protein H6739_16420 [Alphaproteobacteria bacterium]|nr:hypothetical protein [Alphaproteobacteria bacterium]